MLRNITYIESALVVGMYLDGHIKFNNQFSYA